MVDTVQETERGMTVLVPEMGAVMDLAILVATVMEPDQKVIEEEVNNLLKEQWRRR
jgi:hypothetical protein